jgi:C-terminal processing protease CtpA/Prc
MSLQVQGVVRGGPCWQRLVVGDKLTHIGNMCVIGRNIEDIVRYTTGEEGSTVKLKLLRGAYKYGV